MLTRAGRWVVVFGTLLVLAGWIFQYRTLLAIGLSFFAALAVGVALVLRRPTLEVTREIQPDRVTAGQPSQATLTVSNNGRRYSAGGIALERFGDRHLPVKVPPLQVGDSAVIDTDLPTDHRGVFEVGPLLINRSDPLSLVRRGAWRTESGILRVHPFVHVIDPYPSGLSRDLDGPNSGEAPEGGVAFQNLREYVEGDDLRLIHWRSSARSDRLMVRHNVDSHQPRSLILFDNRRSVYTNESFEDAVRAVTSIIVGSLQRNFPYRLECTNGLRMTQATPSASMLDEMAAIVPTDDVTSLNEMIRIASRQRGGFSLTLVTGLATPTDLIAVGPLRQKFDNVTIVRMGTTAATEAVDLPGALLINAGSSQEFARSWNRRVRR